LAPTFIVGVRQTGQSLEDHMRRYLSLLLASIALLASTQVVLGHDLRIEYICAKADGDHLFLRANHRATDGLGTSIAATAEITLAHFGAVCRVVG